MLFSLFHHMVTVLMLEKEKLGFIYFVSVPISYTQQIR